MAGIRQSKFKHVFGKPLKRDECYDCVPITRGTHDTSFCAVNPKYVAIITESGGGGGFVVIPVEKVGRMPNDLPMVAGHTATVLDIRWCPHNNDIIASGSEDCTVMVWQIPEGGIGKEPLREAFATLIGHQRRVNLVLWHPTAQGVLASSGGDNITFIWNIETQSILTKIEFPNLVTCLSFNYNGSKLATCCKDGQTRIVDPRSAKVIESGVCHEGKKPQMCVFLEGDRLFTTGFSKMSERQLALWNTENLGENLWRQELDITNGVLFPFYDVDTNIIFVCGKGDSTIRYFEFSPENQQIYYLNRYDSSDPQRGFAFMPKLGLNVNTCEIARLYKLHNKNWCEVIPFTVPRKSGLFQEDLYPDTIAPVAALSATDWFEGKDANPIKVSVKNSGSYKCSTFVASNPVSRTQSTRPLPEAKLQTPPVEGHRHGETKMREMSVDDSHSSCTVQIEKMTKVIDNLQNTVHMLESRVKDLELRLQTTAKRSKKDRRASGEGDDDSDSDAERSASTNS